MDRDDSLDHDWNGPTNECIIHLGSKPDESLELSAIVGAETSRITDRTVEDEMPDDERNASIDDPRNGNWDDPIKSQEYLMVSKNYVEVCLPTSYEHSDESSSRKPRKHSPLTNSTSDLLDELRNGGLPFVVRKFHEELDEIKADFRSLGEDISETAAELRHQSQSFLDDLFVPR